jgi:RHS repeat-associated protein
MTEAKYFDLTNSGSNQTSFSTDYKFNEKLTYDMRGNITQLWRNGFKLLGFTSNNYAAGDFAQIDALTYTYNAQNQVTRIVDAANIDKGFKYKSASTLAYQYDDNGNLTRDDNKGITLITYNYLNLPQEITFTGNRKLQFVYDAGGAKLRKIANNNGTETTTDYVNGTEYLNTALQRIAHTEGSVSRQTDGSMKHEYVLRDHLGNTRVTFTDLDNDGVVTASDIKQMNHFYPFGLNMEGNWNGASGENKYAYNGKEWNDDFGLGMNDYGARYYDPAVARWWNIDPLTEKMSRHSAYNYCYNNPLKYVDPNGCEPDAWESIKAQGEQAATIANVKKAVNAFIKSVGDHTVFGTNGTFTINQQAKIGQTTEKGTNSEQRSAAGETRVTYKPNANAPMGENLAFIQLIKVKKSELQPRYPARISSDNFEVDRSNENAKYIWYGIDNANNININDDDKDNIFPVIKMGSTVSGAAAEFFDNPPGHIFEWAVNYSMEFQLFVVDRKTHTVYDGISWGITYSYNSGITFTPVQSTNGVTKQFTECVQKWNEQNVQGLEKFE